ncbi:MAG TPA: ATP-binding cassette domain-containing protein [Micromonosporaceae bacterium]|nr:ATP-binding cassette domain-containing protein [Micromonosporaceae bacterium]
MNVTGDGIERGAAHGGAAASIRLEGIRKVYPDGTEAVRGLTLDIAAGEFVVLVGPSGCGKSTILRMVNKLVPPSAGRIYLGDEDITDADPVPLRRRMGYVIQHVGLFPHQNVQDNIATVPRLLGWTRASIRRRVDELLELVGLEADRFRKRYPHELSGGQRQRVGVARALAGDPVVLLMDEPFSAVDPVVRARLQEEFRNLQAQVGKTVLFVTHDVDEAVRLGDRIAVLSDGGTLEQYDHPANLLARPANDFVAEFLGADRAIKRLGVMPIPQNLDPLPADAAGVPIVSASATLRDALVAAMADGADWVAVRNGDGTLRGALPVTRILAPVDQPG